MTLDAQEVLNAAIAMDNHRLNRCDDYKPISMLADKLYDATCPGNDRSYTNLPIHILRPPVEIYFDKTFSHGAQIKDLAEKVVLISENIDRFVYQDEETQQRLIRFCCDVSQLINQHIPYR